MFEPSGLYARDLYDSGTVVPVHGLQKGTATPALAAVRIEDLLSAIPDTPRWRVLNGSSEDVGDLTRTGSVAAAHLSSDPLSLLVTKVRFDAHG